MTRWLLLAVCTLGLATAACDDDEGPPPGDAGRGGAAGQTDAGTGGTTGGVDGMAMDALVDRTDTSAADTASDASDARPMDAVSDAVATDSVPMIDVAVDATADTGLDTAVPGMSSKVITAAAGGTFTIGQASLSVPKGAIDEDITFTVTVRAPESTDPGFALLGSAIYDFGPEGTTFLFPVSLTLPASAAIPVNKKAVVAWLDVTSDQWFPVPSSVSGQLVTGSVSHFTSFAVMLLDKDVSCPFSGACGGDVNGVWDYHASCFPESSQPQAVKCGTAPDIYIRTQLSVTGTVTIENGRFMADQSIDAQSTVLYTAECIAAVNQGTNSFPDCAAIQTALNKDNGTWDCGGTIAQGCSCTQNMNAVKMPVGAVVVAGQKVTFNEDGKEAGKANDYCVNGDSLVVKDSSGAVYTAVRR